MIISVCILLFFLFLLIMIMNNERIAWIDIDLIANDKFIPLFYNFLKLPHLQNEAIECLVELVAKGMKTAAKKLELLKYLRINEVLATLNFTSNSFAGKRPPCFGLFVCLFFDSIGLCICII
jgi:hypothetical protein